MTTTATLPRYSCDALLEFATAAFSAVGMTADDARLVAETLVSADARGVMSHGLARLPIYCRNLETGAVSATAQPTIVREDTGTALVDGQNAMGQVVAVWAMELAMRKASSTGVGTVTVRNSNHLGTCAYYAMLAARRGMIGFTATNGSRAMAPWGGVEPLVGNNPLAIAAPAADDELVVLDMAMTVVARGKIKLAQMRGEQIPLGWGLDAEGRPTQDPTAALNGSLAPVGGYKGYGLAVMVDLLTAALSGAALSPELANMGFTAGEGADTTVGPEPPGIGTGHWMLAIDIARFVPLEEFRRRVAGYAAILKSTRLAEGVTTIHLPGGPENITERERRARGIPYDPAVLEELREFASRHGLRFPDPVS